MVYVQVCVGSSCHLRGAPEIVALLESEVEKEGLDGEVLLTGCFCAGKCNRVGVTVTVNDETFTGITRENFFEFWNGTVMKTVERERS